MRWGGLTSEYWLGFFVVQGSNLCFAFGQVAYKRLFKTEKNLPQYQTFGYFFVGATVVALLAWGVLGKANYPETTLQWGLLIWLGLGASGLGYFLWNYGASRVNAGTLAVMNNALVPAGLLVNLLFWNREVDLVRLGLGGGIVILAFALSLRLQSAKSP
jgi:drug/metabolite transporter (DMT)-like permease